jgi:hypothetical protein
MWELFKQARWEDWYYVFSDGTPPLALQLLTINAVFFLVFAFRRIRGHRSNRANMAYLTHGMLVAINAAILFQGDLMPFYHQYFMVFVHKLQNVVG